MPLNSLLAQRFSCKAFDPQLIPAEDFKSLFEAARWAPSSFNEQPWHFIVAKREDTVEFEKMLHCLIEGNQVWAKNAGALVVCGVAQHLKRMNAPNRQAGHDLGLAVMSMEVQGVSLGLQMREMGGIERDKVRQLYGLPEGYECVSGLAIGKPADPEDYLSKRSRKPLEDFVFHGTWGKAATDF